MPKAITTGYRIGECLAGLGKSGQALEIWRKFLKELPAGPWRGQARVATADLLMEQLDLAAAAEQIRQAAAVLDLFPSPVLGCGSAPCLPSPVLGRGAGTMYPWSG